MATTVGTRCVACQLKAAQLSPCPVKILSIAAKQGNIHSHFEMSAFWAYVNKASDKSIKRMDKLSIDESYASFGQWHIDDNGRTVYMACLLKMFRDALLCFGRIIALHTVPWSFTYT